MQSRAQSAGLPHTLVAYNFVAGREVSAGDAVLERKNPANQQDTVTVAPESGLSDVRAACEAARGAHTHWSRTPAPQRAAVLGRLARLLSDNKEALARYCAREIGKPIREARGSVQEAIDTAEFFQSEGRRLYGQTVPSELANKELFTYRRSLGVVGVITAGNFPIAVPSLEDHPCALVRQYRGLEAVRGRTRNRHAVSRAVPPRGVAGRRAQRRARSRRGRCRRIAGVLGRGGPGRQDLVHGLDRGRPSNRRRVPAARCRSRRSSSAARTRW